MATKPAKNPRAFHFKAAVESMSPQMLRAYRKMSRGCAFPAGWQNGLFHICFGMFLFCGGMGAVLSAQFGLETFDAINVFCIVAGIIIGIALALLFGNSMQTRLFMIRDACIYGNDEPMNTFRWAVPLVAFAACGIISAMSADDYGYVSALSCAFAMIAIFTYYKSNRSGLFTMSLLIFVVPTLAMRMSLYPVDDLFSIIAITVTIDACFFLMAGFTLMGKALRGFVFMPVGDKIKRYLESDNESQVLIAVSYLCMHLDPRVLDLLLLKTGDSNPVIKYVAEVAISNIWGPKSHTVAVMPPIFNAPGLVKSDSENAEGESNAQPNMGFGLGQDFAAKMAEQQSAMADAQTNQWNKHQRRVEGTIREIAVQNPDAFDCLVKLAHGYCIYKSSQRTAIELLGSARNPEAYSTLMTLLLAEEKAVAQSAIVGFYGAGSGAVLYLEKFFNTDRSWMRRRAIRATRMMLEYLFDYERDDYYLAASLLEPDIDGLMDMDDTNTFAEAIALLPWETDEDVEVLEVYCKNDRQIISIHAINALVSMRPEYASQWVFPMLADYRPSIRCAGVRLCAMVGTPEARKALEQVYHDPDPMVHSACLEAVKEFAFNTPQTPFGF